MAAMPMISPVSLWDLLNLGSADEYAWMSQGVCAQTDPEAFHPDAGESIAAAKAVCAGCPVRDTCLTWALDRNEQHGVWGGTSPQERKQLRRSRDGRDAA